MGGGGGGGGRRWQVMGDCHRLVLTISGKLASKIGRNDGSWTLKNAGREAGTKTVVMLKGNRSNFVLCRIFKYIYYLTMH